MRKSNKSECQDLFRGVDPTGLKIDRDLRLFLPGKSNPTSMQRRYVRRLLFRFTSHPRGSGTTDADISSLRDEERGTREFSFLPNSRDGPKWIRRELCPRSNINALNVATESTKNTADPENDSDVTCEINIALHFSPSVPRVARTDIAINTLNVVMFGH